MYNTSLPTNEGSNSFSGLGLGLGLGASVVGLAIARRMFMGAGSAIGAHARRGAGWAGQALGRGGRAVRGAAADAYAGATGGGRNPLDVRADLLGENAARNRAMRIYREMYTPPVINLGGPGSNSFGSMANPRRPGFAARSSGILGKAQQYINTKYG